MSVFFSDGSCNPDPMCVAASVHEAVRHVGFLTHGSCNLDPAKTCQYFFSLVAVTLTLCVWQHQSTKQSSMSAFSPTVTVTLTQPRHVSIFFFPGSCNLDPVYVAASVHEAVKHVGFVSHGSCNRDPAKTVMSVFFHTVTVAVTLTLCVWQRQSTKQPRRSRA